MKLICEMKCKYVLKCNTFTFKKKGYLNAHFSSLGFTHGPKCLWISVNN
jgi:hypothetical protein